MKINRIIAGILLLGCTALFIFSSHAFDQGNKKSPLPIFSNQERPAPRFDHSLHKDTLGCDKCHHIMDENSNKLVYSEGEEAACTDCHSSKQNGNVLSIREASHGSCTKCHRKLKKDKKQAGPTTCGECHEK